MLLIQQKLVFQTFSQDLKNKTKPKITKTKKPNLQSPYGDFFLCFTFIIHVKHEIFIKSYSFILN